MIQFFAKLWELNRPYKGRFLLGIFFGVLNGVGQIVVLATVAFVLSVVFSSDQSGDLTKLKTNATVARTTIWPTPFKTPKKMPSRKRPL